jgi:hypothetical protein
MVIVLRLAVVKIILHYSAETPAVASHGQRADCINGFVLFAVAKTLWGLYKMLLKIESDAAPQSECKKHTHFKSRFSHTDREC